ACAVSFTDYPAGLTAGVGSGGTTASTVSTGGGGTGSDCPARLHACAGGCVDEQADPNNCGACGVTCNGTCSSGRCLMMLAPGPGVAEGIAVDGKNVYWTNYGNSGSVMKCAISGCSMSPTTLASGQNFPASIAVDATTVYWTNETIGGSGTVMKCAISGC